MKRFMGIMVLSSLMITSEILSVDNTQSTTENIQPANTAATVESAQQSPAETNATPTTTVAKQDVANEKTTFGKFMGATAGLMAGALAGVCIGANCSEILDSHNNSIKKALEIAAGRGYSFDKTINFQENLATAQQIACFLALPVCLAIGYKAGKYVGPFVQNGAQYVFTAAQDGVRDIADNGIQSKTMKKVGGIAAGMALVVTAAKLLK